MRNCSCCSRGRLRSGCLGRARSSWKLYCQRKCSANSRWMARAVVRSRQKRWGRPWCAPFLSSGYSDSSSNGAQPSLGQRLLGLYCRRAAQARHLWYSGVSEDVPQRVARRLLELLRHVPDGPGMATVPVRLRQEDLAYMVGSTRTTVSEILNDFERRGLVELKRACCRVDRQKIQQTLWPRRAAC